MVLCSQISYYEVFYSQFSFSKMSNSQVSCSQVSLRTHERTNERTNERTVSYSLASYSQVSNSQVSCSQVSHRIHKRMNKSLVFTSVIFSSLESTNLGFTSFLLNARMNERKIEPTNQRTNKWSCVHKYSILKYPIHNFGFLKCQVFCSQVSLRKHA